MGLGRESLYKLVCRSGIWASQAWLFWMNQMCQQFQPLRFGLDMYGIQTVFFLVLAICFMRHGLNESAERRLDLVSMMLMSSCLIMLAAYGGADSAALEAIALTLGAGGLSWNYLRWGVCFSRLSTRTALGVLFFTTALGSAVKISLDLLPTEASYSLAVLMPVISFACLQKSLSIEEDSHVAVLFQRDDVLLSWKLMLCIAIFSFVCSAERHALRSTTEVGTYLFVVSRLIELVFCLLVLIWVFKCNGVLGFSQLWGFVLVFLSASLITYLAGIDPTICMMLSGVALSLILTYLWLVLADFAHHSAISPYTVFGIGWISYTAPRYLGMVVAQRWDSGGLSLQMAAVLLFALIVATVLVMNSRDSLLRRVFSEFDDSRPTTVADYGAINDRCAACAETYGLSSREVEVLKMICKGRSKAYIAEELGITENTVRSHSKHIYAKLGVHKRSEIQDLLKL